MSNVLSLSRKLTLQCVICQVRKQNIVLQSCQRRLLQGFVCARSASGFLCKACCLAGHWDFTGSMEPFSYFPLSERSCSSFSKTLPSESVLQGSALFNMGSIPCLVVYFCSESPSSTQPQSCPPTHPSTKTPLNAWLYLPCVSVTDSHCVAVSTHPADETKLKCLMTCLKFFVT